MNKMVRTSMLLLRIRPLSSSAAYWCPCWCLALKVRYIHLNSCLLPNKIMKLTLFSSCLCLLCLPSNQVYGENEDEGLGGMAKAVGALTGAAVVSTPTGLLA